MKHRRRMLIAWSCWTPMVIGVAVYVTLEIAHSWPVYLLWATVGFSICSLADQFVLWNWIKADLDGVDRQRKEMEEKITQSFLRARKEMIEFAAEHGFEADVELEREGMRIEMRSDTKH